MPELVFARTLKNLIKRLFWFNDGKVCYYCHYQVWCAVKNNCNGVFKSVVYKRMEKPVWKCCYNNIIDKLKDKSGLFIYRLIGIWYLVH